MSTGEHKGLAQFIQANFYSEKNSKAPVSGIVNPLKIDNRQICSPTDNQYTTPYCSAFSAAQYFESLYWRETGKLIQLDAEAIYKKAKTIDGLPEGSSGTTLSAAINAAIELCGWDLNKFRAATFFRKSLSENELKEQIKFRIHKHAFMLTGFDITNGWYVCSRLTGYKTKSFGNTIGSHCVLGCGYDETGFYVQNSWGKNWGDSGFGIVPWKYFWHEFNYCAWVEKVKSQ